MDGRDSVLSLLESACPADMWERMRVFPVQPNCDCIKDVIATAKYKHCINLSSKCKVVPIRSRKSRSRQNLRECATPYHKVGDYPLKNNGSHIDASLSRQPLVKGERLVRAEMNAVIILSAPTANVSALHVCVCVLLLCGFSHSCCWRDRFAKRE